MSMVGVLVGIGLIMLGVGYYFNKIAFYPKTYGHQDNHDSEIEYGHFDATRFDELYKEEVYIDSRYGYKLYGLWVPNKDSKKVMIICHGYTMNLYSSIKYMNIFYKRGYSVLLYDHRYHGRSGGKNCTLGLYEKYDLMTCVDWVIEKVKDDHILIGTHGESMGAATVLMHAAMDDRVSFVVADCPFENLKEQFKSVLKSEYKLPSFPVIPSANLVSKFKIRSFYGDISPINVINDIKAKILFIHGDNDNYIPYSHTMNMYNKRSGNKTLYLAKGADHAESFQVDKVTYERVINEFLDTIDRT